MYHLQLEDLEQFRPWAKISWKWIVNELLPEHKEEPNIKYIKHLNHLELLINNNNNNNNKKRVYTWGWCVTKVNCNTHKSWGCSF